MTREDKEAIIRRIEAMYGEAKDNETKEALFYAIEALQENESLAKSVIEANELLRKQRPHGEWLFSVLGEWRCSRCKKKPYNQRTQENFCPNCGADMRAGDKK